MRKVVVAVLAAGVALGSGAVPPAHAEEDPAASLGRFTTPFREDGATYEAATNRFTGTPRGDTGCLEPDSAGHRDCLPAGATQNVLADGRILYWNAIEGAEDLDSPDEAVTPSGGDLARNDRSRLLSLNWANPGASTWAEPANPTGYFPGSPTEPPLIPGTDNSNPGTAFNNDGSLFCADQKQLPDGRILAAGGTNYYAEPRLNETTGVLELEGVRNARVFDPADDTWKPTGDLKYGRWYPSMVTLEDGDVFIASGVTKLVKPVYPSRSTDPDRVDENGDNVPQTETYDVGTGTWSDNGEAGQRSLPLFPRLHLLPNGHVYYDAAGQSFNPAGQSYKQALWNIAATYDPATRSWADLGVPGLEPPVAGGPVAEPGFRGSTFSQALPLLPAGGAYPKASFLTAGGVTLMSPGSYLPTATTRINTVDVSGSSPSLSTVAAGPLNRPRWYSSAVTLPTGQVLAFSGADVDEVVTPGSESPIRKAELFTPKVEGGAYVGGEWQDVATAHRKRTYHNVAVLLPDGRVLVGGHAPIPNGFYNVRNNPDLPGREASNNYKDASFELYEPPYLHWGVSRPVIGTMNPFVEHGKPLVVPTPDSDSIESVVLVRNPSETHLIDGDQRVVVLPFTKAPNGAALNVDVTANRAALPPGPYMLFLNKSSDRGLVPSVAKQVFVGTQVPGWARGADTYPTDGVGTRPASPGSGAAAGTGSAALVTPPAVGAGLPADLAASPISATRAGTRRSAWRHAPWAAGAAALLAAGAGARRRRASGSIWG